MYFAFDLSRMNQVKYLHKVNVKNFVCTRLAINRNNNQKIQIVAANNPLYFPVIQKDFLKNHFID